MRAVALGLALLTLGACSGPELGYRKAVPSPQARATQSPAPIPFAPSPVPSSALGGVLVRDELGYVWATSLSTVGAATAKRIARSTDAGRTWRDVTPEL